MSTDRFDVIRDRLASATPGPWHWLGGCGELDELVSPDESVVAPIAFDDGTGSIQSSISDADLIANAPADLACLLAEVDRLRARLAATDPDHQDTRYDEIAVLAANTMMDNAHGCCDHIDTCACSTARLCRHLGITQADLD